MNVISCVTESHPHENATCGFGALDRLPGTAPGRRPAGPNCRGIAGRVVSSTRTARLYPGGVSQLSRMVWVSPGRLVGTHCSCIVLRVGIPHPFSPDGFFRRPACLPRAGADSPGAAGHRAFHPVRLASLISPTKKRGLSDVRPGPDRPLRIAGSENGISRALRKFSREMGKKRLSSVSGHPYLRPLTRGVLAQLVRAPPCHGGGCGFEPRRLRHSFEWRSHPKTLINTSSTGF